MSRNTQKVRMGMCLVCGNHREEDYHTWCKKCLKEMQDSHTKELSANA